MLFCVFKYK